MLGTIAIGCDHAGYELKESLKAALESQGYSVKDFGCHANEKVDYPDIALTVAQTIQNGEFERGLLCCGSGIGVAIAANRLPDVRAIVCHDHFSAAMSRRHNDANIICFGGRVTAAPYAEELLNVFLTTEFEGGRHTERVQKMSIQNVTQGDAVSCQI